VKSLGADSFEKEPMAGRPIILVCFTGFAGFPEISKLMTILASVFGIPRSILVVPMRRGSYFRPRMVTAKEPNESSKATLMHRTPVPFCHHNNGHSPKRLLFRAGILLPFF
jgi:hypothetical protein